MGDVVKGSGNPRSKIWLIGEAPAQEEVAAGKPFVGTAGKLLRRFCMQVGIDPTECFIDNLYPKRAPRDKLGLLFKAGIPVFELVDSIVDLTDRIEKYRPNIVVALGAIPTHVMTGKLSWNPKLKTFTSIQDWRGFIYEHKVVKGQKVISTYHPSYINREGYSDHGIFLCDLERVRREAEFPEIRRPKHEFIIDPRAVELNTVLERLMDEGEILTVDIEYVGSNLLCIGMTTGSDWATCIVTRSQSEIKACRKVLLSGKPINMQNAMFDASILEWHYQIPVMPLVKYDTMLAAHALNIELPKRLEFLSSLYTDQPNWKDMVDWDKVKKGQQSLEDVWYYNCLDVVEQHTILEAQLKELADSPAKQEVFEFEMALLEPLWEISKRGIRLDQERMAEYKAEIESSMKLDLMALRVLNLGQELNVKSGPQVAEFLFNTLGLRPAGKTKGGKYKTDDKTLAAILGRAKTEQQRSAINFIRAARRNRDLLSKFVDVELDEDGRSRGMYNPAGTVTGRLASRKFTPTGKGHQQQNIPRAGRHVFVPDKGLLFGSVDYERAESLVVAHLTNDPIMLDHHKPGADAHKLLAQLFFEREEITKDERYLFKKTRHAGNYMEGHITFMRDVNQEAYKTGVSITASLAESFINWYRSKHVGLRPWWGRVRDQLRTTHELTTLLGRPRTFFQRVDAILPEAVAYNPQGTVGELMELALLTLAGKVVSRSKKYYDWWEEIPEQAKELESLGFQLLNQVHDSVGFQFPPENETRIREIVHRCLHIPLVAPLTLETFYIGQEFKVGKSWGEAS